LVTSYFVDCVIPFIMGEIMENTSISIMMGMIIPMIEDISGVVV